MAYTESPLVTAFDEIVAASNILNDGSEKAFCEFIQSQLSIYEETEALKFSVEKQRKKIEAKDIELKLSRNSLEKQMNKCAVQEEKLKEYEKQFMILKVLISSDEKLINLNEAERRSLAILRQGQSLSSPGINCTEDWGTPETSVNVTDATDLDDDENVGVGFRAQWKRRRTASSEWTLDSSISKKKRSVESSLILREENRKRSLDLELELNMTPPLEKQFKKPPPGKNRRKPSRGHLINRNVQIQSPPCPSIVPPLNLPPQEEDYSPLPSAPPEFEVALVNSGILSPHSNEGTPPHLTNPDMYAAFPHSPLSPLSMHPHPPSSPSMVGSPRLYPSLEQENAEYVEAFDSAALSTPTKSQPSLTRTNSDINMTRKHNFQSKTALKLENCEVCKKRVNGFGKNFMKCQDCRAVCCADCQNKVPLPCVPTVKTPKKKQKDSELSSYCPNTIPRVPSLIVHCVKELENRGLNQVGLYRVPGSERSIKDLKERLLRSKGTPNLDKVDDVNVLCGCIKQFLISLKEPIVTFKLNPLFLLAVEENTEEKILATLLEAIAQLPACNKDTLAFVILHLQKVIERSHNNKMPIESIASVFGPTIIGSTSNDPAIAVKDLKKQKAVLERLLAISSTYWRQYLSTDDNMECDNSPRTGELTPIPSMFNSPSTPELMPIPQSPFLGPCQSPRSHRPYGVGVGFVRTPVVTRSASANAAVTSSVSRSAKKNGFFAAIN